MRIGMSLHPKDENLSGVEYYALGLVRALADWAQDNEYVVYTGRPDIVQQHVGGLARVSIRPIRCCRNRVGRVLWEQMQLPGMAERDVLDLIHCPCRPCPIRHSRARYVVTVHDTFALDHPEWCRTENVCHYRLIMKQALARASAVIAVSKHTADSLARHMPGQRKKIHVVWPGLDPDFHCRRTAGDLEATRARYRLPEKYVLYVGNIEPRKNLPALILAHDRLVRLGCPHPLVIVGKRSWKARNVLRQLASPNIANRTVLPGYVRREDLPGVYQMAELYVCASWAEGFGFPPLEAMASGIPVLSSKRGALAEVLADAAYTLDPADPAQVAEAMRRMLTEADLRKEYIERGLARSRLFNWQETARQVNDVHARCVA